MGYTSKVNRRMAEGKEATVQKSYRLPKQHADFIDLLAKNQILGSTPSAVVRHLLGNAIKELIEQEFVKKSQETFRLLKGETNDKS